MLQALRLLEQSQKVVLVWVGDLMSVHLYTNGAWTDSGRIYRNSLNLFNGTIEQGGIDSNGYMINNTTKRVRAFIDLTPNTQYTLSTSKHIRLIFAYNDDERVSLIGDYSHLPQIVTFTTPSNTNNIGIAFCNENSDADISPSDNIINMLVFGSIIIPYEPYNVVDWYTNTGHGYSSGAWS